MRIIVLMHAATAKAGHKFGPIRHFVTGSPNGGGGGGGGAFFLFSSQALRPNGFLGLSMNDRTFLFLVILLNID